MRYFAVDGTDHASQDELAIMIHRPSRLAETPQH